MINFDHMMYNLKVGFDWFRALPNLVTVCVCVLSKSEEILPLVSATRQPN